mgnify:CR=1 FL=1|tara:strand:- start:1146 stop:1532 length:387 start_codon:yes stop_codon:yes gene_type:complete
MNKLKKISELSKSLGLINKKNDKPLNYIIRYWEKEFKQLRPKIINKRRYYSNNQVEICKLIKFLLKDKKMTIKGAKNLLNFNTNKLDDYKLDSLKADYYKLILKEKSNNLLIKMKKLKNYGKKISRKS